MSQVWLERGLRGIYAGTVFLSAFLLFQVQPLLGKFILPWFGGTPAVWTTCMLVFQTLLFGGYAYAHFTTTWFRPRQQVFVHIALLILAVIALPIAPDASWKPDSSDVPTLRIILLTLACVGLPYFVLSATGPLVQAWFSLSHRHESPYRLYALSNLGSLLALISYPFVFEQTFSTGTQAMIWALAFLMFCWLCAGCGALMARLQSRAESETDSPTTATSDDPAVRPSGGLRTLWFCLAATPSVMLLATTNQVCQDVAVIPFLWVAPLTIYLITFILSFDSPRWYSRKVCALGAVFSIVLIFHLLARKPEISIVWQVGIYFSALFFCCFLCHRELANLKPHPRYLTGFFLTISAGGAAGGMFVGLAAPYLFRSYHELQLSFIAFALLCLAIRTQEDRSRRPWPTWLTVSVATSVMLGAGLFLAYFGEDRDGLIQKTRNFYGVLQVRQQHEFAVASPHVELVHGRIVHGLQFTNADVRQLPTTYYSEDAAIGRLLNSFRVGQPRHVGVIGLGIGTLAAYAQPNDRFRFYEINPDVVQLAQEHFTFLRESRGDVQLVTGDARLVLEHEATKDFDVLVLDAFSGDAIPVHLLTKEAMAIYLRHLRPDGVLACHISNLHFDLRPVIAGLAEEIGWQSVVVNSEGNPQTGANSATWSLLSREPESLSKFRNSPPNDKRQKSPILWTDDRSNLLDVL